MAVGDLISGAIPTPFDLAMLTYSSKLTKEYLLGSGGLWRFYLGGTKLARFCHKKNVLKGCFVYLKLS